MPYIQARSKANREKEGRVGYVSEEHPSNCTARSFKVRFYTLKLETCSASRIEYLIFEAFELSRCLASFQSFEG